MLDVKHRAQNIRELRRLFKIYDMLNVKESESSKGYSKSITSWESSIEIEELKSSE
jgi:hypothetical protein